MDVTPGDGRRRPAKWIAPALLAVGLIALLATALHPLPDRSPFELGLLYTLTRYEQSLPLAGLGFAFAQARFGLLILNSAVFAAGIPLGGVAANWIVAALAAGADIYDQLRLLGPFCCTIAGLTLISPAMFRAWLQPAAALASAVMLGMVINLNDPTAEEWWFAAGAMVCGVWLVAAPFLLWRRFERPWFPIAARIFGSWLIAIGVLLGALYLVPPPAARPPPEEAPSGIGPPSGSGPPEVEVSEPTGPERLGKPPRRGPPALPTWFRWPHGPSGEELTRGFGTGDYFSSPPTRGG